MTHKNLLVDTEAIIGDGVDFVELKVSGAENDVVIVDILTGDTPSTADIVLNENGVGSEQFACSTPATIIQFSVSNPDEPDNPAKIITKKVRVL